MSHDFDNKPRERRGHIDGARENIQRLSVLRDQRTRIKANLDRIEADIKQVEREEAAIRGTLVIRLQRLGIAPTDETIDLLMALQPVLSVPWGATPAPVGQPMPVPFGADTTSLY